MDINRTQIKKIIDMTKSKFRNQHHPLYWNSVEDLDHDEKVAVAYIEAISVILKVNLDVLYKERK